MSSDVERQLADYFGWVERQAGVTLSALPDTTDSEVETIAALERELAALPEPIGRRPHRFLALAAAAVVVAIGATAVLLTLRTHDAGRIVDEPPVTEAPSTTTSTVPSVPSTRLPTRPSSAVPTVVEARPMSPEPAFSVGIWPGGAVAGPSTPSPGDTALFTAAGDTIVVRAAGTVSALDVSAQSLGPRAPMGITTDNGDLVYSKGALYDATRGNFLRTLPDARGDLRGDFSPDGTRIVVPAYARRGEATATVYDTATGDAILDLTTNEAAITWAMFSPDGSLIMTLGRQGVVRIWDASTGEQLGEIDDSSDANTFSPDGSAVLSVGPSGRLRLWDAVSGEQLGFDQSFPPVTDPRASFSPDGRWIVVTTVDQANNLHDVVTVWDAATSREVTSLAARAHTVAGRNLAWSADGQVLATVSPAGGAEVWSIPAGTKLATIDLGDQQLLSVDVDAQAMRLAGVDSNAQVHVWELR